MKIIQLTAENVKRLKVVDITPTDDFVLVSGPNESGKSSVLDSIWWALGGEKNIPDVPIRRGADSARIRLDLGGLIVERKFSATGTTSLTVRDQADGPPGTPDKKLPPKRSPQDLLDALIGKLAFDPLEFANMKPRDQYDTLKAVVKIDTDLEALAAANDADYKTRTELNRQAKEKAGAAASIQLPAGLPAVMVDESELLNKMQVASDHNAGIERDRAQRQAARSAADEKNAEANRLREKADEVRRQTAERVAALRKEIEQRERDGDATAVSLDLSAESALEQAVELDKRIDETQPLPGPISIADIRTTLETAKATNSAIRQRDRRVALLAEGNELERRAQELTERMAKCDRQKIEALAKAEFPVPEMGLDAGRVFYKGLPFDQASDSERLRVSTALAMAQNPTLRVIRIKDGSLLDNGRRQMLRELAKDRDYQIWVECVDETGTVGIVMEDGTVVANNQGAKK